MSHMFRTVADVFIKRPLLANTLTMFTLYGAGDFIQQLIENERHKEKDPHHKFSFDPLRMARMCSVGTIMGPPNHYWYIWIDRFFPGTLTMKIVAQKVFIDQAIFAPFCSLNFFFLYGQLEGRTVDDIWDEICLKFWPTYAIDCAIWPAVQFFNFKYVPQKYRVLYISMFAVAWNVFLSHQKHYDDEERELAHHKSNPPIEPKAI